MSRASPLLTVKSANVGGGERPALFLAAVAGGDRLAEFLERRPQFCMFYFIELPDLGQLLLLHSITCAGGDLGLRIGELGRWHVHQLQSAYRAVAKMSVDALYDLRFQMLKFCRSAAGNADVEHAVNAFTAWKDKLLRLRVPGNFGADDGRPFGNDAGFCEPSSAKNRPRQFRHQCRQRPNAANAIDKSCRRLRLVVFLFAAQISGSVACRYTSLAPMARRLKSSSRSTDTHRAAEGAAELLSWYDCHRRRMPWRSLPGETPDPYCVWLSEIMLQQTTVAAVEPYFGEFLKRWPNVRALAAAELDDVLHGWQGLGYYARARNLHRCAQTLVRDFDSAFPTTEAALVKLPGVGSYTAAAVAAIAFNQPAVVVDGNVERVMARLYAVDEPLPAAKPRLRRLAAVLTPMERPGDYAQAVMDLGATICTPRRPKCVLCPWQGRCAGKLQADVLPRRSPKKARPTRRAIAYWITNADGAVLLRRRAEAGLLGGMIEVPSGPWIESAMPDQTSAQEDAPIAISNGRLLPGLVRHTFTHFHLELLVLAGRASDHRLNEGFWCALEKFGDQALPSLIKKVVLHATRHALMRPG